MNAFEKLQIAPSESFLYYSPLGEEARNSSSSYFRDKKENTKKVGF